MNHERLVELHDHTDSPRCGEPPGLALLGLNERSGPTLRLSCIVLWVDFAIVHMQAKDQSTSPAVANKPSAFHASTSPITCFRDSMVDAKSTGHSQGGVRVHRCC